MLKINNLNATVGGMPILEGLSVVIPRLPGIAIEGSLG